MVFFTKNALHVSGGSSAHHQEIKTVYTASDICRGFFRSLPQLNRASGKNQKKLDKYPMLCVEV